MVKTRRRKGCKKSNLDDQVYEDEESRKNETEVEEDVEPAEELRSKGSSSRMMLAPLPKFDPTRSSWEVYARRLKNSFELYDVPAHKRVLALLASLDEETYARLSNLCAPELPENRSVDSIINLLNNFFHPEPSKFTERVKFQTLQQKPNESIQEFLISLKNGAKFCKFPESYLNEALCTQFLIGLRDDKLRFQLLSSKDLTLEKAVEVASGYEVNVKGMIATSLHNTNRGMSDTAVSPLGDEVARIKTSRRREDISRGRKKCFRCLKSNHADSKCFFKNSTCFICKEIGHIAKACQQNKNRYVKDIGVQDSGEMEKETAEEPDTVWKLRSSDDRMKGKLTVLVKLGNGTEEFQIDTGASVSLMGKVRFFELFPKHNLKSTKIQLKTYTNETVKVIGVARVEILVNNQSREVNLYVIEENYKSMFGMEWLRVFKLDWGAMFKECSNGTNFINQVSCHTDEKKILENLFKKYHNIFKPGVGKVKGIQARIHVKEGSRPVFKKARPVPYTLLPKLTQEIERLEKEGVISKVDFSDYATPVVPIVKKTGAIRLCGDFKVTLNPQLKVDEHPIPNIEYLLSKLGNNNYFSKIDVTQAYTHIDVHPEDRRYLTINTHKGLYAYNRLPFGISSAPAIWQRTIDQILNGIGKVAVFFDDICIASSTKEEHYKLLEQVFDRLNRFDVRVNTEKCEFFVRSVEYCGYKISEAGIEKCIGKVEAVLKAREPKNVKEVKSFLGLVNFYGRFVKNLSTLAHPLNNLLRKGTKFNFDGNCKNSFEILKKEIASKRVLAPYDPKKKLILATDASPWGVGAVLSHVMGDGTERPISFASRALSKSEINYSQIDKEALSIIFGVKKFYSYIYGRHFTLITDHKPLVSIFHPNKEIPKLSATRMQHYAIYLQAFDYDIIYRKTNEHGNADMLSRFPLARDDFEEVSAADLYQIEQLSTLPVTPKEIASEVNKEPDMSTLVSALRRGCQIEKKFLFGHRLEEFTIQNDCILWCHRVYIPKSLRLRVLKEMHEGHQGIVKTKSLARSVVWWPGIDRDIEHMIRDCEICQQVRNNPPKENWHPWDQPSTPMERIHIDYAGPMKGYYFLIIVDSYSKWTEVYPVKKITSQSTINCLMRFFSAFGLPNIMVSDNGPQFKSREFEQFCKENGIVQRFSAPFHPATNGLAERNIQTFKNSLHMAVLAGSSLMAGVSQFLIQFRRTPHCATGVSPAKLFLGRDIKIKLDLIKETVLPKQSSQEIPKRVRELKEGDRVAVRFYGNNEEKWKMGVVDKRLGVLHYEVEVQNRYHMRHIDQLRKLDTGRQMEGKGKTTGSTKEDHVQEEVARGPVPQPQRLRRSGREHRPPRRYQPT